MTTKYTPGFIIYCIIMISLLAYNAVRLADWGREIAVNRNKPAQVDPNAAMYAAKVWGK